MMWSNFWHRTSGRNSWSNFMRRSHRWDKTSLMRNTSCSWKNSPTQHSLLIRNSPLVRKICRRMSPISTRLKKLSFKSNRNMSRTWQKLQTNRRKDFLIMFSSTVFRFSGNSQWTSRKSARSLRNCLRMLWLICSNNNTQNALSCLTLIQCVENLKTQNSIVTSLNFSATILQ